jgi:hypothetical protein
MHTNRKIPTIYGTLTKHIILVSFTYFLISQTKSSELCPIRISLIWREMLSHLVLHHPEPAPI